MQTVDVQGDLFSVRVCGTGDPVLLVHGYPMNHSMWNSQLDHFASTHRLIAPDLRGFGQSVVTSGTVTMAQHADDLAGVLDALGIDEPIVLCGLSMGGYIAWQFWSRYRHRLRGLILCDTRAAGDTAEAARGRAFMAERVRREGTEFVADAMLPKLVAESTAAENPELVASLGNMIQRTAPDGVAASQLGMAQRPDFTDQLAAIDVPTLLLVGQHDVISPPTEMRTMADAIPNARFAEIPDAGHMAPMENPVATNAAMEEFLAGLEV